MMRNIVKQGPSTLMISLPSSYVKKYNLQKGEQLEVREQGSNLVVSTHNKVDSGKVKIELFDDDYVYIWRVLSARYYSGFDEMEVHFSTNKALDWIQYYTEKYFIGFEMIKQDKNYCIIKSVSQENKEEFDPILRRIFLNLVQIAKIYLDYLEKGDNPDLILNLERTNNRQTSFLKRIITKNGFSNNKKTNFAYTLMFLLETIINEYKFSVWHIQKQNELGKRVTITPKILKNYKRLLEEIENVYKLYYKYDEKLVKEIIVDNLTTKTKTNENIDILDDNPHLGHTIINITEKIRYIAFQIMAINS